MVKPEVSIAKQDSSDYALDVEDLKRRIRDKVTSFPKIFFIIYIILALSSATLIGYLLTYNSSNNQDMLPFILKWGLYILSLLIFVINCVLIFLQFPWKKFVIGFLMIIQIVMASSSILVARNYGQIGDEQVVYYMLSHASNIFTGIIGFIPLYMVYS